MMNDLISRQEAIEAMQKLEAEDIDMYGVSIPEGFDGERAVEALRELPSAEPEIIRCKGCKHNPKYEWFGCPMSHLSEAQRPETAWCWKGERRTDAETEV